MLLDILDTPDISGMLLDKLNFKAVRELSNVSKVIHQSHDWRALLESKVLRLVSGKKYVSTPSLNPDKNVFTVTRKTVGSKTVMVECIGGEHAWGVRLKVQQYHGQEYVNIGRVDAGKGTTQDVCLFAR